METRTRRRHNKQRKIKRYFLYGSLTIFIIILGFIGIRYFQFQKTIDKMNALNDQNETVNSPDKSLMKDNFSVLLLGVDERENDRGRTDTMIVATVNPSLGTVKMLSIPRDSRVEIVGNDTIEKINHAYARGGIPMTIDTVENVLNIPIDYYVAVNMEGFLTVIDTLGGIEVENDMSLSHGKYQFPKGTITLTGEEALVFSRIRYEDSRGDFGRQIRQKQILEALFAKMKNPKIILQLDDVLENLGTNVQMNFTMKEMKELPKVYNQLDKNIEQLQFERGNGKYIDSLWYYILDEAEVNEISKELRAHLEIDQSEAKQ